MTELLARARLTRPAAVPGATIPPVRIVHLGLGAFHRAHQAWYTAHATDAAQWGIAAFTGHSADLAERLTPQDGLYTIVERDNDGDRFDVVPSIVRTTRGADTAAFVHALADPEVVILTLTITEAGYRLDRDGRLDCDHPEVRKDIARLRRGFTADARPITALARILLGLDARRRADAPPIAIVPCDNIPANGRVVEAALRDLAERIDADLAGWLDRGIRVVSTSVDRITPRVTDADIEAVREMTGWIDQAPVVTEPFADWVLCGDFPAGHPDWESAGARFVDEIEPWERRKLWMLNGAHTLLALLGGLRGHRFVAQAVADPVVFTAVEALWDEAARQLPAVEVSAYRRALSSRFRNERIAHSLEQIAEDSLTKLRLRVVPVAILEREAGRSASASAAVVAAWITAVRGELVRRPESLGDTADTAAFLAQLDGRLAADTGFRGEVDRALAPLAHHIGTNYVNRTIDSPGDQS